MQSAEQPVRFAQNWSNYQTKLITENCRLYNRLASIADKDKSPPKKHKPGSLLATKKKLEQQQILDENMRLGTRLMKKGPAVPDRKAVRQFDIQQSYQLTISSRFDRVNRADPLVSKTKGAK